jgi:hypothetical protein
MQFGLFQVLAAHGLSEGYLTISEEISSTDPRDWTPEQMKRRVHATRRCMLEVY